MKKIIFTVFCATVSFSNSVAMERATEVVDYHQKERENLRYEIERCAEIVNKEELSEERKEKILKIMDGLFFKLKMLDFTFRRDWFSWLYAYDDEFHSLFRKLTMRVIEKLQEQK